MPTDLACPAPPSATTLAALELAAFHLHRVADRVAAAGVLVRRLAASTDWQTPAARAFFLLAGALADDVDALEPLTQNLRSEIRWARERATAEGPWTCR